jgi:hypothetical protein
VLLPWGVRHVNDELTELCQTKRASDLCHPMLVLSVMIDENLYLAFAATDLVNKKTKAEERP